MSSKQETVVRYRNWIELTDSTGTTNANLDAGSAIVPVVDLVTAADATNGRYFFHAKDERNVVEQFMFAGQNAADETFGVAIKGWRRLNGKSFWVGQQICQVAGILGSRVGIAGAAIDDTWFFPDSLVFTYNNAPDGTAEVIGGEIGQNGNTLMRVDIAGFEWIEVELADNGSSAAVRAWHCAE